MGKKMAIITVATILQLILLTSISNAQAEWEMNIIARVLNAENKLTIGQRADATDGMDGRYDVPALLAGDIKAYIELEGQKYWKDIRQTCNTACKKAWNMLIESEIKGQIIELSWDLSDIPDNANLILIDTETGKVIDMNLVPHKYTYKNLGRREFIVEVERW